MDPSWKRWLSLVDLAVAESQQPAWSGCIHVRQQRVPDAPLLHESTLSVDGARAREFARRLAESLGIVALEAVDPLTLLRIGVERDSAQTEILATRLAVPVDTVAVLGQLFALPLLLSVSRAFTAESSRTWQRGYCPVCGAWPAMVEMRGIQRERRMRCGCCGSDWMLPVLRCPFCGEMDHRKLGSLLSEGDEQRVRVETCITCHGYLKSVSTLGALPFTTLVSKDMSTITFDFAAQDCGYARPARAGWQLHVDIAR